ncbi:hypothetical protein Droror1_Dr00023646 [Drosera rotundifolia]
MKKVLFLRLGFSMVAAGKLRRSEWEGSSSLSQKSSIFSSLISGRIGQGLSPPQNPQNKISIQRSSQQGLLNPSGQASSRALWTLEKWLEAPKTIQDIVSSLERDSA